MVHVVADSSGKEGMPSPCFQTLSDSAERLFVHLVSASVHVGRLQMGLVHHAHLPVLLLFCFGSSNLEGVRHLWPVERLA